MSDEIPASPERIESDLQAALYKLAVGATVEEIGKDEQGNTKLFKRKLPPNLDAIKYLREIMKAPRKARQRWQSPELISREPTSNDTSN